MSRSANLRLSGSAGRGRADTASAVGQGTGASVHVGGGAELANWSGLLRAVRRTVRYRFFLLAGVFPYLLGAAVAYHSRGLVDWRLLLMGLAGVVFVSAGIEGMNEYFDSKMGGDRVFGSTERVGAAWHLPVGLAGFALALAVALVLMGLRGRPVLWFALFGAAAALCYLLPPVRLSYRGLGEAVIAVSYGPGLTLGGFYLQAGRLSWTCLLASMLPGLLILALALANEVPDYYGDRLVGKRNLIVRMGRRGGAWLYAGVMALCFGLMVGGLLVGWFPPMLGFAVSFVPLAFGNGLLAIRECEAPARFVRAIRGTVFLYVLVNAVAISSYIAK